MGSKKAFILDDNKSSATIHKALFEKIGYEVFSSTDSTTAIEDIRNFKPDLVVSDAMMPNVSGAELCKKIRSDDELKELTFIIASSKTFDVNRNEALEAGADDYWFKPLTVDKIKAGLDNLNTFELKFWGVRGTLPVPGEKSIRYGGNTNCVTLKLSQDRLFIFDAGSGLKELSNHIMSLGKKRLKAHMFISHHHWDHINAFPFFTPLYIPGNHICVHGPYHGDLKMEQIMSDQMNGVYFPVTVREFGAHVTYEDLDPGNYEVEGVKITTFELSHPGGCLGYKIEHEGKTIVYMTDNELFLKDSDYYVQEVRDEFIEVIKGADILMHDTTYTDKEYPSKVQWGHSCVSEVAKLAHDANVKNLYLIHHDPDQNDDAIDAKHEACCAILKELGSKTQCVTPTEGSSVDVSQI